MSISIFFSFCERAVAARNKCCFQDQLAGPIFLFFLGAGSLKNLFGQVPKRLLAGQDIFDKER